MKLFFSFNVSTDVVMMFILPFLQAMIELKVITA